MLNITNLINKYRYKYKQLTDTNKILLVLGSLFLILYFLFNVNHYQGGFRNNKLTGGVYRFIGDDWVRLSR